MSPSVWFIAGTDTEVGKTFITAAIARALCQCGVRVGVYKPVASGCRAFNGDLVSEDAEQLWSAAGQPLSLDRVCPQRFVAELSPPEAAKLANTKVDESKLVEGVRVWQAADFDIVLVEGAGGLFSPISENWLNIDLLSRLDATGCILVAANRLGCVHQTLATCRAAEHQRVAIDGIVLSNPVPEASPSSATNAAAISSFTDVPVLADVRHGEIELPDRILRVIDRR